MEIQTQAGSYIIVKESCFYFGDRVSWSLDWLRLDTWPPPKCQLDYRFMPPHHIGEAQSIQSRAR